MEFFVHKYLSRYYLIDTSYAGNDGLYSKEDTRRFKAPYNGHQLLRELNTIFGIPKDVSFDYVNNWAVGIRRNIDLEFYWKEPENFLPISYQVAARTIGMDLVPVQPMDGPSALVYYLGIDPASSGDSATICAIKGELPNEIIEILANNR